MIDSASLGDWKITALRDAKFALDGGAMFGVVPRAIWEKMTPVNEDHTIPLATRPFLFEKGDAVILVEPGIGRRWSEKAKAMFHFDYADGHDVLESLAHVGRQPEEVTHVLMSHGHWDHIGALCDEQGVPNFPNAQHWMAESEKEAALHADHLRRASYRAEDLQPVMDAGLLHTFQGEVTILPGLRIVELGGHSDGVSLILLEEAGETACFWSDVVPTGNHVHRPFIMAYDMNAEKSYAVRGPWVERAIKENWLCLLYHDAEDAFGRFFMDGRRPGFQPEIAQKTS
ncbi:MAG: MBL fold metallo-hydrolase [Planctomycetota bacterium]|nr:MBL fold metallo-hydrolase [Planctomycetota bacterium]